MGSENFLMMFAVAGFATKGFVDVRVDGVGVGVIVVVIEPAIRLP